MSVSQIAGRGGFGGGGARQSVPVDSPNTLRSTARARLLLCLGEGQVEGFTGGSLQKSVLLDGTPLESPNGTLNFKGFTLDWRNGSPDQSYIPGFSRAENERPPIAQLVRNSIPVVRTIFDNTVDAARVRIRLPSLRQITDKGVKGYTTQYHIEYASAGSPYRRVVDQTISDKADSQYERSHEFVLEGNAPWDIRVTRPRPESDDTRIEDAIIFQALTEIQYEQQRYPDTVLLAVDIDAKQFNSIPQISVMMRGLRVLVPHNYNPNTRTYSGAFDGSLVPAWTNNPAWILYDILTDVRYGAKLSPSLIDVYDFYEAAVYCDEEVSNGEGGFEKRWSFNATIDSADESFKIATAIASSFHGKLIPKGSRVGLIVDKLKKPIRNYGHHNVVVGRDESGRITSDPFIYRTTSLDMLSTVANVSYREPQEGYETRQITVEDSEGIAKWGFKPTDITALGCTSRTQARRYGLWKLFTDRIQSRTVSFQIASEGLLVAPGEVIGITDKAMSGLRLSGRISQSSSDRITLDDGIIFSVGTSYELLTIGADGKLASRDLDLSAMVLDEPTSEVIVLTPFSAVPATGSSWALRANAISPQQFIVTSVQEETGGLFSIEALQYAPQKYAAIDDNVALERLRTTNLIDPLALPAAVSDITTISYLDIDQNDEAYAVVSIGWQYPESGYLQLSYFEVSYRLAEDVEWIPAGTTVGRTLAIRNLPAGVYIFRVAGVNRLGLRGPSLEKTEGQIISLQDLPSAVTNLQIAKSDNRSIYLRWDYITELDVRFGGYHIIKHSPKLAGATWKDGSEIARVQGHHSEVVLPFRAGTYQLRTFDSGNNPSEAIPQVQTTFSLRDPNNIIQIFNEGPDFSGIKTRTEASGGTLRLELEQEATETTPALYASTGEYRFSQEVQLGASFPVYVYSVLDASVFSRGEAFDLQPAPFDAIPAFYFTANFDNADINFGSSPSATLQVSISQDGIAYSDWADFTPGEYLFQNARFRLLMETEVPGLTIEVRELQVVADVPDRQESGRVSTTDFGVTTVNYVAPFFQTPEPQLTIINQEAGDTISITVEGPSFISFEVRNAGGRVARDVSWISKGFGKEVAN